MAIRFGVFGSGQEVSSLPAAADYRRLARLAEDLGYDSLWAGDHLAYENPILESMVALSFFAGCTERIQLGTSVYLLPLRPAAAVAKQLGSLERLAPGRLVFGVGVGGEGDKDFEAVGVPRRERGARTDEGIDVVRTLLGGSSAGFEGSFTSFRDVTMEPRPTAPVPIWIGGRADAALQRVALRGDGWLALFQSPGGFARSLATIRDAARAAGRDPSAITGALALPTVIGDDDDAAVEALADHLTARYGQPFERHVIERYCLAGTPERCISRLREYVDAGVEHIIVNPGVIAPEREDLLRRFQRDVMPAIRDAAAPARKEP